MAYSNERVLKLVHPGRHIKIHRRPITAAKVLEKYPRHSVTRPDFFEYPLVVVKPESLLNLGKTYFIVPNRIGYQRMKLYRKQCEEKSPRQSQSPKGGVSGVFQKLSSPSKVNAGGTPKHANHQLWLVPSEKNRRSSRIEAWPEVISKYKDSRDFEEELVKDFRAKNGLSDHEVDCSIDTNGPTVIRENYIGDLKFRRSQGYTMIKSCIRKPNSTFRFLQLKVSFVLPDEEEQQGGFQAARTAYAGYHPCGSTDFVNHLSLVST